MDPIIKQFQLLEQPEDTGRDVAPTELINDDKRRVLRISIKAGATLKRHLAPEPITVVCLSGSCIFRAGADLSDSAKMTAGTLVALDANIEHEVEARENSVILVSRFK